MSVEAPHQHTKTDVRVCMTFFFQIAFYTPRKNRNVHKVCDIPTDDFLTVARKCVSRCSHIDTTRHRHRLNLLPRPPKRQTDLFTCILPGSPVEIGWSVLQDRPGQGSLVDRYDSSIDTSVFGSRSFLRFIPCPRCRTGKSGSPQIYLNPEYVKKQTLGGTRPITTRARTKKVKS